MMAGSAVSRFARTWAGDWERVPNLTELCETEVLVSPSKKIADKFTLRHARAGPAVLVHVG